mmetsp:Transcript_90008/g.241318  ORF Transcript_90008/g.241318 Transcript_90008/m.241318 type:complete len:495 (-) Transcript_90008:52-1536(-)
MAALRRIRFSPRARARATAAIPGPARQPLVGNLFNYDLEGLFSCPPAARLPTYAEYGDVFQLDVLGTGVIYIRDVEVIKEVLRSPDMTNSDAFRTSMGYYFPNSMIVLEGVPWQRIRKIGMKALQKQKLDAMVPYVISTCQKAIDRHLTTSSPVEMHDVMSAVTFDAFHQFAYELDMNCVGGDRLDLLHACKELGEVISRRSRVPFETLWKLPLTSNREADQHYSTMRKEIGEVYEARVSAIQKGEVGEGVLDNLLTANEEEDPKSRMTKEEILDQIATFFFRLLRHHREHTGDGAQPLGAQPGGAGGAGRQLGGSGFLPADRSVPGRLGAVGGGDRGDQPAHPDGPGFSADRRAGHGDLRGEVYGEEGGCVYSGLECGFTGLGPLARPNLGGLADLPPPPVARVQARQAGAPPVRIWIADVPGIPACHHGNAAGVGVFDPENSGCTRPSSANGVCYQAGFGAQERSVAVGVFAVRMCCFALLGRTARCHSSDQ